ncbi:MAG: hypothetical protein ACI87N_002345 [Flavobacteriales bacterium]
MSSAGEAVKKKKVLGLKRAFKRNKNRLPVVVRKKIKIVE